MNTSKRTRLSLALVALLLLPVTASSSAEPASSDSKGGDTASLEDLGIRGSLRFNHSSFFSKGPNDNHLFLEEGIFGIEWDKQLGSMFHLRLAAEVRGDSSKFADGVFFQVPETDLHRSYVNLKEASLRFNYESFDLTFGKQFYDWGTADVVNPTDYVNPYDFLDVPQRYKMAVYSISSNIVVGPVVSTTVIIPWFTPSRQPLLGSRWAQVPSELESALNERDLPSLDSVQFAQRLKATVGGWDLSVSYYDGFEHSPVLEENEVAPGVSTFTPVFSKIRSVGFDFSTTYGKFEFHGEGVFQFVVSRGRDNLFKWIVGTTYMDEVPIRWIDKVEITFEYARETVLRRVDSNFSRSVGFFSAGFRNAIAGGLRLTFSPDTEFRFAGTVDLDGAASVYLQPMLQHRLRDDLRLLSGFDVIAGPRDTFWGRWRDNDRWFMSLEYFF